MKKIKQRLSKHSFKPQSALYQCLQEFEHSNFKLSSSESIPTQHYGIHWRYDTLQHLQLKVSCWCTWTMLSTTTLNIYLSFKLPIWFQEMCSVVAVSMAFLSLRWKFSVTRVQIILVNYMTSHDVFFQANNYINTKQSLDRRNNQNSQFCHQAVPSI